MKTVWLTIGIILLLSGYLTIDGGLKTAFDEINALIPAKELNNLSDLYLKYDNEVKTIFDYMKTQEIVDAWFAVASLPEVQEFQQWVMEHYNDDASAEQEEEDVNALELRTEATQVYLRKPGWKGFLEEYLKIYPMNEVATLVSKKVKEGGLFADFWHKVQAMRATYERILNLPQVVEVIEKLSALGFDKYQFDKFLRNVLGWN